MTTPRPKAETKTVVDQQEALTLYLDALLSDVALRIEAEDAVPPVAVAVTSSAAAPVVVSTESMAMPVAPVIQPQAVEEEDSREIDPLAPDWACYGFQALTFQVAGLKLAVPLEQLHGILEWSDAVTPLFGHADWFLGLLENRETKVKVVDIAKVVMPENHIALDKLPVRERASHVVLVDEGRWGLACDSVSEVVTLGKGDIRWRSDKTKRRWLAGTAIEHMCAVLDLDELLTELHAGYRPAGR
jgi:purine-binding chemotaxis protein CheW